MNWFLDEARARMSAHDSQTERMREFLELSAADHEAIYWIELWRLAAARRDGARGAPVLADAHRRTIAGIIRAGQRTGEFGPASPDKVALDPRLAHHRASRSARRSRTPTVNPGVMHEMLLDVAGRLLSVGFQRLRRTPSVIGTRAASDPLAGPSQVPVSPEKDRCRREASTGTGPKAGPRYLANPQLEVNKDDRIQEPGPQRRRACGHGPVLAAQVPCAHGRHRRGSHLPGGLRR